MRRITPALLALFLSVFQIGCNLDSLDSGRFREDFQYAYGAMPGARLTLDSFNGDVDILSWEKDSVQITGVKYASSEEELKDLRIDVKATGDSIAIRTVRPASWHGGMGAKYFLRVPANIDLDRIVTSNGAVRVEDIRGRAHLETSNGAVRLRRIGGRLEASTSNGSIDGDDLNGDVSLRTSNGAIHLDGLRGALDATTSNGAVSARWAGTKPGRKIAIGTSNGAVEADCGALDDDTIDLSTSNASVTLRLLPDVRADIRATTSMSAISSDFDVVPKAPSKTFLEGRINGGGSKIAISTSNAPIHLIKK